MLFFICMSLWYIIGFVSAYLYIAKVHDEPSNILDWDFYLLFAILTFSLTGMLGACVLLIVYFSRNINTEANTLRELFNIKKKDDK